MCLQDMYQSKDQVIGNVPLVSCNFTSNVINDPSEIQLTLFKQIQQS